MGNEIQKSLAQRTKELLQTEEEHSLFELAELLRQYRNETHPDKFQGQELKDKAEARFKDAQALLDELEKQLEIDRFNRKPSELAVYRPLYDVVKIQSEKDKLENELREAKKELESEREENAALNIQVKEKSDSSLKEEIQYLQDFYRPSTRKFASIGMAIVLSGVLAAMSQMERVSTVLQRYSPFSKEYITTALFGCMMLAVITAVRKMWEQSYIKTKSEEICSSKSADEFLQYLKRKRDKAAIDFSVVPVVEFSEVEAFDFIAGPESWRKKFAAHLGFQIHRRDTVARLSDIFIHFLLNRKLAHVSKAENMQRYFAVSNSRSDLFWYQKYQEEVAKRSKT